MCLRYQGLLLLAWFSGALHAQSATRQKNQSCAPPNLNHGYFVPELQTYSHESNLTYACNKQFKPAAEGWWATSTCNNAEWIPVPQCIAEVACLPPHIPNADYQPNKHWYSQGGKITVKCHDGYEDSRGIVEDVCLAGAWHYEPVCLSVRSVSACAEPPRIPHAVVLHQYKDHFAPNSEVQYQCEDGYTLEGGGNKKSIRCTHGTWTEGPTCRSVRACAEPPQIPHAVVLHQYKDQFAPNSEVQYQCEDGYTLEGGGNKKSIRCIDGTWTEGPTCRSVRACAEPPRIPHAVILHQYKDHFASNSEVQYQCEDGYTLEGGGNKKSIRCIAGTWTEGPTCRATEQHTGSGTVEEPTTYPAILTPYISAKLCGNTPHVPNGEVVETTDMFLKYACASHYSLTGPEHVYCQANHQWTQLPVCKDSYCVLNPDSYPDLRTEQRYIQDNSVIYIPCIWTHDYHSALVECRNKKLTVNRCCRPYDRQWRLCT